MGYLLRMSDEIHDWLADLPGSDPSAAMLVGEALVALLSEGASLGPPLVASLASASPPEELLEALDQSYQDQLEQAVAARRRAADGARAVKGMQDQAAELELAQAKLDEQSQRLQARIDAFRTRKEVLKATYTAARASLMVHEAIAAPVLDEDDRREQQEDPGDAITEAAAQVRDVTAEIERELGYQARPEGLLELRPGAPGDSDMRMLFAVEPPGTVLLIAVLEGSQAVRDQHRQAVMLSGDVLRQARAGQAPEAAARGYDDTRSFLDEFFPGNADDIGAARLPLLPGSVLARWRSSVSGWDSPKPKLPSEWGCGKKECRLSSARSRARPKSEPSLRTSRHLAGSCGLPQNSAERTSRCAERPAHSTAIANAPDPGFTRFRRALVTSVSIPFQAPAPDIFD